MKENVVSDKSFQFAVEIVKLARRLHADREFVLADQILRSGTSIGANIEEAIAGQSRKDFISKMAIASKEARETRYWLRLLQESDTQRESVGPLLSKVEELVKLLTSIVKSTSEATRVQ